jgi:hypothetical protein
MHESALQRRFLLLVHKEGQPNIFPVKLSNSFSILVSW